MSPAEAEDDSHREAHVVLPCRLPRAGGRVLEPGHRVFGLNQAQCEVASEREVESASGGHGKRVLGRERSAADP